MQQFLNLKLENLIHEAYKQNDLKFSRLIFTKFLPERIVALLKRAYSLLGLSEDLVNIPRTYHVRSCMRMLCAQLSICEAFTFFFNTCRCNLQQHWKLFCKVLPAKDAFFCLLIFFFSSEFVAFLCIYDLFNCQSSNLKFFFFSNTT